MRPSIWMRSPGVPPGQGVPERPLEDIEASPMRDQTDMDIGASRLGRRFGR